MHTHTVGLRRECVTVISCSSSEFGKHLDVFSFSRLTVSVLFVFLQSSEPQCLNVAADLISSIYYVFICYS